MIRFRLQWSRHTWYMWHRCVCMHKPALFLCSRMITASCLLHKICSTHLQWETPPNKLTNICSDSSHVFAESLTCPVLLLTRQGFYLEMRLWVGVSNVIYCHKVPMTPLQGWQWWGERDGVLKPPHCACEETHNHRQAGIFGSCCRVTGETD